LKWEKYWTLLKTIMNLFSLRQMAKKPTLDINGESLSMQAGEKLGIASVKELLENNADNNNDFSFENLSFVHLPGGHAPMLDFLDNPELDEVLNQLLEQKVITSLICHAPI